MTLTIPISQKISNGPRDRSEKDTNTLCCDYNTNTDANVGTGDTESKTTQRYEV